MENYIKHGIDNALVISNVSSFSYEDMKERVTFTFAESANLEPKVIVAPIKLIPRKLAIEMLDGNESDNATLELLLRRRKDFGLYIKERWQVPEGHRYMNSFIRGPLDPRIIPLGAFSVNDLYAFIGPFGVSFGARFSNDPSDYSSCPECLMSKLPSLILARERFEALPQPVVSTN